MAVWNQKKNLSTIDVPQVSQGCQKIIFFFYKWNCFSFVLRLPPKYTNFKNLAYLVDPGASFDTSGTPGSVSIVEIQEFWDLFSLFCDGGTAWRIFHFYKNVVQCQVYNQGQEKKCFDSIILKGSGANKSNVINNLKKTSCASKRDVLELATLQYVMYINTKLF